VARAYGNQDIQLYPQGGGDGANDVRLYEALPRDWDVDVQLYPQGGGDGANDVRLYDVCTIYVTGSFPTQYLGLRIKKGAGTIDLCLVAVADAPSGMGGQLRIFNAGGTPRVVYLVETTDPNASPLRIKTSTGIKAIRLKT